MNPLKSFASDNNSGAHPRIFQALERANRGSAPAYGADPWTDEAAEAVEQAFGGRARAWFVFTGTAANVLGLQCMLRPHQGLFCTDTAHVHCDECGAPEAVTGSKLILLPSHDGKVRTADMERPLTMRESVHSSYPRVLSIAQATECGTVYTLDELREISAYCRKNGLYLHMDGARLSNAAARLGVSLKQITADAGVDALSFGGTKNGLLAGEAVVFLNPDLGGEFEYARKQHMQLGSKMRFVAAQFTEYLRDELWRENALAANSMAALLAGEVRGMDHVRIAHPVEVNAIFARLHKDAIAELRKEFYFYTLEQFDAPGYPKDWRMVRWMTSFNTTEEQVREFAAAIRGVAHIG